MVLRIRMFQCMLIFVIALPQIVIGQNAAGPVPITAKNLEGPYKAGAPIVLKLTISNTLEKEIEIIGPIAAEDFTYKCRAHITSAGSNVEISERPIKNRTRSYYPSAIAPKSSIERVFEITRVYDLFPGTYNVRLGCFYNDGVSPQESLSNQINFTITP
jgi:hypothetical protein